MPLVVWARWIRLGWITLTASSLWVFAIDLFWVYQYFQNPPGWLASAFAETGISPAVFFALNLLSPLVTYFSFFVVAQLIMLRRRYERSSVLAAVFLLSMGTANAVPLSREYLRLIIAPPLYWGIPFYLHNILAWTLATAFVITYPNALFVPRWTRWAAGIGFIFSLAWTTNPQLFYSAEGLWAVLLGSAQALLYGAIFYAQIWRYRYHLSPVQRQQVKWFVFGVALAFVGIVTAGRVTPILLNPDTPPTQVLWAELLYLFLFLGIVPAPLAIGFGIVRYRLWDIDIIIRRTLTYASLVAVLATVYFSSVILLQQLFATVSGARSEVVTVLSTLAIAALFVPLRNRIQSIIDKRFYRNKYDAQAVLNQFSVTMRDETDLEDLTANLIGVVRETMQPKSVSFWLKGNKVEGRKQAP